MTTTTKTDFSQTRAALALFKSTKPARDDAWADATCDIHCNKALAADKVALEAVQEAFYLDTQDINSRANVKLLQVYDIERMIKEPVEPIHG